MEIKAKVKYLRGSPRRARLVADLVRGKDLARALSILTFANQSAAVPIKKLVESAAANAEHNFKLAKEKLFVREIKVDGGPVLKRACPRAFGRSAPIRKRACHISIILADK